MTFPTDNPPHRKPKLFGRWRAAAAALTVLLFWHYLFGGDGPRRVSSMACAEGGSIATWLAAYPHPFDIELGGSLGYRLTYEPDAGLPVPLYDDNFSVTDSHGSVPSPYASWRFDGKRISGPHPSYTFAPLPSSGTVRVFDREAQVGAVSKPHSLNFMNIFVDPRQVAPEQFAIIADCLAAHRVNLDRALAGLGSMIPISLRKYYHPLRLGGIYLGATPYLDPSYMRAVADELSASTIPAAGGFLLFPGRSVKGVVHGHRIDVRLTNDSDIEVRRDGALVTFDAKGNGNQPGIQVSGGNIYLDRGQCADGKTGCGELIQMIGQRDDLSAWFLIFHQLGSATFGETDAPSPFSP